jgi:opacity protein-like surface antigen
MKKKFTLLMASMMLLGASAAQAWTDSGCCYEDPCCEDQTGFYIGGFGGANFISTSRDCGSNTKRDFNTGYVLNASIGYRWCHDVRFEFEYAYRNNQGKHRNRDSGSICNSSGSKRKNFIQNAYMFNGFYDLGLCNDWCIKPFVGAGIGYVNARNAHHHNRCESTVVGAAVSSSSRKKDKNGFAWQLIAGIAYPICDEVDLSLEYRFFKGRERRLYNNDVGVGLKYYF